MTIADTKLRLTNPSATIPTRDPGRREIFTAALIAVLFVFVTRLPVARAGPIETDEFGYLEQVATNWFPVCHTLFLTSARSIGFLLGDAYRGFIVLDLLTSALALVSVWWWLRAICSSGTAAASALLLGVGPIFWGYGTVAGNYTAIVAVGAFLLGIAYRGHIRKTAWHPYGAAVALALGAGYRPDIGTLWLSIFIVILWRYRWKHAIAAGLVFTILNLVWFGAMLHDAGGWERYRAQTADFAYRCGYLNSIWHLGFVDATLRYALKLVMAVFGTFGLALFFFPRGMVRLRKTEHGGYLAMIMAVSVLPALGSHLLVHFGVAGYSFHYVPALIALIALGIGGLAPGHAANHAAFWPRSLPRLVGLAALSAAAFWYYPTDYNRPGFRGNFDLAFCRFTRVGVNLPMPDHGPSYWRTANSTRPASEGPGDGSGRWRK